MKNVTIPSQFLQELLALCGPEDHELRERVLKSAAPAHHAEGVPAQVAGALQALRTIAEYPATDLMMNMDAANMRLIAEQALAATQPAAQGVDARDAAFEAVRKEFCKLQRYSFALDSRGNVRRCADHCGNWVEFEAVHTLFEPQSVDAALAAQAKQGGAA